MDEKSICEVCKQPTSNCPPSPFLPCSYWRCQDCAKNHRIAYWEVLCVLCGTGTADSFDARLKELNELLSTERWPNYGDRYLVPSLDFFGKSKELAWSERHQWKDLR